MPTAGHSIFHSGYQLHHQGRQTFQYLSVKGTDLLLGGHGQISLSFASTGLTNLLVLEQASWSATYVGSRSYCGASAKSLTSNLQDLL